MMHSSILKGWVGRGALSLALVLGAVVVFLMTGGLGEGQDATVVEIKFPENGSGTVAAYTAEDPEGEDVTWTLAPAETTGNDDLQDFSIDSSTGILTFITPPDFEAPGDTDTRNTYNVIIQATDVDAGLGNDSADRTLRPAARPVTRTLVVTVTDVEEAGVVTLTTLQPQEGVQIEARADGPRREAQEGSHYYANTSC